MAEALAELRERKDVRWTYISPACVFQADGERTGEYILGGEELTLNSAENQSFPTLTSPWPCSMKSNPATT